MLKYNTWPLSSIVNESHFVPDKQCLAHIYFVDICSLY